MQKDVMKFRISLYNVTKELFSFLELFDQITYKRILFVIMIV